MMGAVSIGLSYFLFSSQRVFGPELVLLYGDLDPSEASRIANELQTLDI